VKVKKLTLALAIAAIGSGTMATMAGASYLKTRNAQYAASHQIQTQNLLVVKSSMPIGSEITEADLAVLAFPVQGLHADVILPEAFSEIVGTTVKSPITADAPLLRSQVNFNRYNGLTSLVGKDQRIVTLPVNPLSSFAFMLQPEDRVDVLYTDNDRDTASTVTLLTDMRVLATDRLVGAYSTPEALELNQGYSTVTLACDAEACQKLIHAQTRGELSFVLSHQQDAVALQYPPKTTTDDLLGIKKPVKRKPRKKQVTVRVYDGQGQLINSY